MAVSAHSTQLKPGYKLTEVGVIPEDWKVEKLGNCLLGTPQYGINAPAVQYIDSLPTYIRITDITDDGSFSPENIASVRGVEGASFYLKAGDLVFARTGASVGKTYLYKPGDGNLVFAGYLIRVKANPAKLLPEFLAAYVKTKQYWDWVRAMSMRSGQPGINGNEYAQLPIPLPPLPEQRAIAAALSDVDALIASLDRLIAKKRAIKQATMQQLLTGKTRLTGFGGERKPTYKQTEVGEIPEDWEPTPLGLISAFITKGATPTTYGFEWVNDGVLFLRSECVSEQGLDLTQSMFITPEAHNVLKRGEVRAGDILITIILI
jgi:type I restriction enzyme S subunit